MEKIQEVWKAVPGYEGSYEVSNYGKIRSLDRESNDAWGNPVIVKGRELLQQTDKDGYKFCSIKDGDKRSHTMRIHRAVAMAFIPNPDNLPVINHKDEVKDNNIVTNLEWCTVKYNNNYGSHPQACGDANSIAIEGVDKDGNVVKRFKSASEAGRAYGVDGSVFTACCKGNQCTAYGLVWRYEDPLLRIAPRVAPVFDKSVDQYTMDGKFIQTFPNIKSAAEALGLFAQSVSACCNGRINHTGHFKFRFHNPEDINKKCKKPEGKKVWRKEVIQMSMDYAHIATFRSVLQASKITGCNDTQIYACCHNIRQQTGGYRWKYAE